MGRWGRLAAAVLLALLPWCVPAQATTYLIRPDGTGDLPTVGAALAAAQDGDDVILAAGTYYERDLQLDASIVLRSENGDPETTWLDAQWLGQGLAISSGEVIVQDLGFRNGSHGGGGCVSYSGLYTTFWNCIFEGGDGAPRGTGPGGAVLAGAQGTFSYCTFRGTVSGAAAYVAPQWYEIVIFDHCLFADNVGGAIVPNTEGQIQISYCTIVRTVGAALRNEGPYAQYRLYNVLIADTIGGPALAPDCPNQPLLSYATCCNFFGNEGGDYPDCLAVWRGADGNVSLDPKFCDVGSGDFRVASDSPCAPSPEGCGGIGALGVGCAASGVEESTWSRLKAAWR
ncbi:MAG: hypothetical protein R3B81_06065 [bacterium]